MKVTKTYLKQVIKEELDSMGEAYRKRFGSSRRQESPMETAKYAIEDAISANIEQAYAERKAEMEKEGRKIVPLEKYMQMIEQEKNTWLSSYDEVYGSGPSGDVEDRNVRGAARIMAMPPRLRRVLMAGERVHIPHWDVVNNMPDSDY